MRMATWRRERESRRKVATRSGAFSQPGGAEEPTVGGGAATCRSWNRSKLRKAERGGRGTHGESGTAKCYVHVERISGVRFSGGRVRIAVLLACFSLGGTAPGVGGRARSFVRTYVL